MEKPICLITGATDGLGKATAVELVKRGFTVVLGSRDAPRAERAKTEMTALGRGDVDYIVADLASLKAVRGIFQKVQAGRDQDEVQYP